MRIFKITQQHCQNNSSHWEGHKKKDVYSPQLHLLWSYFQRDLVLGESVAITGNGVLTTFIQMRKDLGIKKKGWIFFNKTNASLTDVASPLETENAANQM